MATLTVKHTRQGWRYLHPRKVKKKLVHGVSKDKIVADWLKTNGWMTKRPKKPPYKFIYRKEITKLKKGAKTPSVKKPKSKHSKMSLAARKAWKTRRKNSA